MQKLILDSLLTSGRKWFRLFLVVASCKDDCAGDQVAGMAWHGMAWLVLIETVRDSIDVLNKYHLISWSCVTVLKSCSHDHNEPSPSVISHGCEKDHEKARKKRVSNKQQQQPAAPGLVWS